MEDAATKLLMPITLKQLTQPSHEPLALADVKSFLRIVSTDQDDVICALITAARVTTEQYLRRIMVAQQWKLLIDKFPGSWPYSYGFGATLLSPYREIHIPLCPLISVDAFQYVDMDTGDLVTMDPTTDYQVDVDAEPARLQPAYGQAWPIARWTLSAITITFTTGYGDTTQSPQIGTDPPMPILTAMKLMIAFWYENRESQEMPKAAENLLQPYRVWDVSPVLNNWERFGR